MRKPLVIGLIVSVVLFCVCVGGAIAIAGGALFVAASGPQLVVNNYYNAVRAADWRTAHSFLAPSLADGVTPEQLRDSFTEAARQEGLITGTSIRSTRIENNRATVDLQIDRERGGGPVAVHLIQMDDQWRINDFSEP